MQEKIEQFKKTVGDAIEKYRFWFWPATVTMFVIMAVWSANASTDWPIIPLIIGLIALFFAMHGEEVFSREIFHTDYFLSTTLVMLFAVLYGMVFCLIMGVIALVVGV